MSVTSRQKKILTEILTQDGHIPVGQIASVLSVSNRTVLRELGEIEQYLAGFHASLEKKPAHGIRFIGDEQTKQQIFEKISKAREVAGYSKDERRLFILSELLKDKNPVKTFVFTKQLGVSEATVSADLDRCEEWLKENGLRLVRKPGVGVYAKGEEREFRRAMINLFYDNFDYSRLSDYDSNEAFVERLAGENIFNIFEKDVILKIKNFLDTMKEIPYIAGVDRTYIAIIMHLYLVVKRIQSGEYIKMNASVMEELRSYEEYGFARTLADGLEELFHIQISDEETGYLAMILRGAQGAQRGRRAQDDLQAEEIVAEIISIAEGKTGYILSTNTTFYNGLMSHIVPTLNRLKMNLEIRNPLLEDIKSHYSYLFSLAKLCAQAIESKLGIPVPEAEIGYIAMHLGVALENKGIRRRRIFKAIICCPAGMVSARLLSIRVEREFSNIQIVDIVSTANIERNIIEDREIELVISTIPMPDTELPCATVSPFLLDGDKEKILAILKAYEKQPRKVGEGTSTRQNIKESLSGFKEYIDGILQVLGSFFFINQFMFSTMHQVIELVAQKATTSPQQAKVVEQSLLRREKYSSTIVEESKCMLLHCRTAGVTQLHFGIIRPNGRIWSDTENRNLNLNVILVMLAPENCPQRHVEVLGSISQGLINYDWFAETLLKGSEAECYAIIEKLMSQFYEEKRLSV